MTDDNRKKGMLPGKTKKELAASDLPIPDRNSFSPEEQAAYDYTLKRSEDFFNSIPADRGTEYRLTPLFQGLIQSPLLAQLWAHFGDFYQTSESRGSFNNRERDVALLSLLPKLANGRTGKHPLSAVWITWAVASGVKPLDIRSILEGRPEDLQPADRQIFEFVRATESASLTREHFNAMVGRWNAKTAIEFISFITYRIGVLKTVQAHQGILDQLPDPAGARKLLQEYIDGKRKAEDYEMSSSWIKKPSEKPAG
ncbi:MAG TPA: hypothetical protein VJQ47_05060 [Steroidobacteraceae bacterium]|nr:hypothetical protein [Steroidobacteraceae bacterium]